MPFDREFIFPRNVSKIPVEIKLKFADRSLEEKETKAFLVIVDEPHLSSTKLSKKSTCIVEILPEKSLESEFKRTVRRNYLNYAIDKKTQGCLDHIMDAIVLTPTIDDYDTIDNVSYFETVRHFVTFPYKVLFALVIPPRHWFNGWATLIMGLAVIVLLSHIIQDLVLVLDCTLGMKVSVTAVSLLPALILIPEVFTSVMAAKYEKHADAAVGRVFSFNALNLTFGIGLPWVFVALRYRQ